MYSLAAKLKNPFYGNVVFLSVMDSEEGEEKAPRLYAFSDVWECPAFEQCRTNFFETQTNVLDSISTAQTRSL